MTNIPPAGDGSLIEAGGDDGARRVYATRPRQWLIAGSLVGIFVATLSMVFEPDPSTGIKPLPGDYLWVVIPGTIVLFVLIWRALKARVETDKDGITLYRVAGHESIPWADIRGFEVHPTPSRQGSRVRVRRRDEGLVTVRNEIRVRPMRNRDEARRLARIPAEALREQLDADRRSRASSASRGGRAAGPTTAR